jgi:hypothetical protein
MGEERKANARMCEIEKSKKLMRRDFMKVRCDNSIKEITDLRKEVGMMHRRISEARYWARKMMAERDKYKKVYDSVCQVLPGWKIKE